MPAKAVNALILLALAVMAALASSEIEPYLSWLARSRQKHFCSLLLDGKMGEASQLIPEDSRTDFIRGAKEIPVSCGLSPRADEVLVKYQDGRIRTYWFTFAKSRLAPWKHARLASVSTAPPASPQ